MTDEDVVPPWIEMVGAPVADVVDIGPELLDRYQSELQMDEEWVVRTARALTWWGDALPLTFTVEEPRIVQGDATVKLTVAVTVLADVNASTDVILGVVDELNHIASAGAYVWLNDERRIDAFLTHYHHDGLEPITRVVGALALQLYGEAVGRAAHLAEQLDGTAHVIPHPVSGVREDYDDMMTFTDAQVLPTGAEPNRWHGDEFDGLARYLTENGIGISTGATDGLTIEFPLARNSAEVYRRLASHHATGGSFESDPIAAFFTMPTALMQLLCVDHPIYRAGLMSLLRFPVRTGQDATAFANDFNLGEYRTRTGIPALGAWSVDDSGLAHSAFIPNFYYQDWVAPNLAFWASSRTDWAFSALAPDLIADDGLGGSH